MAAGLNASWIAVTLERHAGQTTNEAALRQLEENLRLAERLGGEVHRLLARDLVDELLRFARKENITQIIFNFYVDGAMPKKPGLIWRKSQRKNEKTR